MATLKTKKELSTDAATLATSFQYVRHNSVTYAPQDFEVVDESVIPDKDRTIWVPLKMKDIQLKAKTQFDTLFESEAQCASFAFMVGQEAIQVAEPIESLLIRTKAGLRELKADGQLHDPSGEFIPNTLLPVLNEDPADKAELFTTITEWVGSEEEALAMLRLFSTVLSPGWSAARYVLLIGDGRNGKSVMMEMLAALTGRHNTSSIKRQDMAAQSPALFDLNGKLLNIVMDGQATYVKDSGLEKSLIAGEPVGVRRLYSSELATVQTNALFIEGLNREPKSSDKSSALQARLSRFWFPNVYDDDLLFRERMLSERYVGALLALLLENFVQKQDKAVMLEPTKAMLELQLEHMHANSLGLQFVSYVEETDPLGASSLVGMDMSEVISRFKSWRVSRNDLAIWDDPDVFEQFRSVLTTERKSARVNGQPRKVRFVTAFKKDAARFLAHLKEEVVVDDVAALVED